MFVNFSNHPSERWGGRQLEASEIYGTIVDLPFPAVDPACGEEDIGRLAEEYAAKIMALEPDAVLCQGEFTLVYRVVGILKSKGVKVLSACSARKVIEKEASKEVFFEFCRYREY